MTFSSRYLFGEQLNLEESAPMEKARRRGAIKHLLSKSDSRGFANVDASSAAAADLPVIRLSLKGGFWL